MFSLEELHYFFSTIMKITQVYEGRLNSFSVDDKGENLFFHFGAPNRLEKKEEAAAEWALEVKDKIRKSYPRVDIRIGMTEGQVFWGIVGGSGRFHYTVVGDSVNVAARLMQSARKGQICVDHQFQQKLATSFRFAGPTWKTFRGKGASIGVYRLLDRANTRAITQAHQLIGRTSEFQQVVEHLRLAQSGSPRFIVVEGEAGVGKSFLAEHVLAFAQENGWRTASGKSEITRRSHSYVPWLAVFQELGVGKPRTLAELQKMLKSSEAGPASLDESAQKSLLHHQLCLMLLEATNYAPTLIFLDDLHFFDSLSAELLSSLLNHWKNQPLLVLAATRPEWDKAAFVERSDCHLIQLSELSRDSVVQLAALVLGGPVRKPMIDFLVKQSRGNPFFSRHLLEYLKQNDLLVRIAGEWTISRNAAENHSLSGEELIVSQIERLALNERIHLRAAACMGPTFSLAVLKQALGKHFQPGSLRALRERGYFAESEEGWLSFPHALVQEALYHSLSTKLRRQTHRRIGHVMESLLTKQDSIYYANLANHFRLAGVKPKAIHYSIAAADQLFAALSFPEARNYFQTAYELLQRRKDSRKWEVGLKLAKTMMHTGNTIEALRLARKLRRQSRRIKL
ncbi:MAG TPA: BREX system ATP-binding domain-containing protein, partial [Acidobacteriota bacterium]